MIDNLINELLEKEQLININIDSKTKKEIKIILRELCNQNKIKSYQIGDFGNCGYCIFINEINIVIPISNNDDLILAC